MWAGHDREGALELYQEILSTLESQKLPASPALLASVARLAQQTGNHQLAIEFEERALLKEHPHLPEMINLQAFRQRYQWLWERYSEQLRKAAESDDEDAVGQWLVRAEGMWQRWYEVDRDNTALFGQMATLQAAAGEDEDAWLYLSSAIDLRPKDAESYSLVSSWHHGRGELREAERWLAKAQQWDTANPRWLVERAKVLKELNRGQEARRVLQQVIQGKWAPGLQGYVQQAKQLLNQ